MIKGGLAKNRTAGIARAEKENIHVYQDFAGV